MLSITLLLQAATSPDLTFPGGSIKLDGAAHGLSGPVRLVLILTALSFVPAMMVAATSFTRIIIVLSMLRQAIGMNTTPPNSVLISLALFLTVFTMSPVLDAINHDALTPYLDGHLDDRAAVKAASLPLKLFLAKQTKDKDIALICELSHKVLPKTVDDIGLFELLPAFMLSELRTAFEIGFIVFLPFVLIDLVVASVLMSLGMIMVPPLAISLPIKILMFVLIDGWGLLTESLVRSFHG
jgi:flagellar biosynthetic protein FliP